MTEPNRRYPLPDRHHDIVDDINDLRSTFRQIDSDISYVENSAPELTDSIVESRKVVIRTSNDLANTEIQNIGAKRYLVVNRSGDGFECLEGGGDAGGKRYQCSIKQSDQNFDTAWGDILNVSKNGMTVKENSETSQGYETHIFVDEAEIENDEQRPRVELTNCQAKSNLELERNAAVILRDEIEENKEEIEIATNLNDGLIKAGSGLSINNGTLTAPIISKATKNSVGIIKAGEGLVNEDGKISRGEINHATFSDFGIVKLGGSLSVNSNGETGISDMATIYDLGQVKVCNNGIVDLEELIARYRMPVTKDLVIQFNVNFEAQADFSFVLELISDGTHLVAFNENLNPKMTTLPINRGTTKITFTKKLGVPSYDFEVSRLDAPEPVLLTPNYGDDINSNLMVTHNGSDWNAHDMLKTSTDNINFWGREFFFEFATLVVVDYVFCHFRYPERTIGEFWLKGSNDNKNWTTLLYKNNETINGNIYTEIKGCFRYFKLYLDWKDDNYPRGFQLLGTQIDNNESELVLLTPTMSSNETGFAKLTYSNLHENGASQLTDADANSFIYVKYSEDTTDLFRWIKYEFPEAVVANLLDVAAFRNNLERTMRWYKLEGSNDDENWTLLLERQYQRDFTGDETRWHEFENTTAYKFYKLTCLATNGDQYWRIGRFRLLRRELGKHNFYNVVPTLTSATQDGYVVTSSSYYGSHYPYHVFDGETGADNKWLSNSGDVNGAWLKIELPEATAVNSFLIQSPNEGYRDRAPKKFKIQGSNDDTTWTDLVSETNLSWSQNQIQKWNIENETAFKFYRMLVEESNGANFVDIGEFSLGQTRYEHRRYLEKYDNVIPTMASDETIGEDGIYRLSSSTEHSDHKRKYLFDKRFDTRFELSGQTSGWIQVELPIAKFINVFSVGARNDNWCVAAPRNYTLLGSNDGTTWTELFSVSNSTTFSGSELRTHELTHNESYKFYRLNISNPDSGVLTFARWDLIVRELIQEY